jgi:predicted dehydrogenase
MPRTIKVGVITSAEGAHLDSYFRGLADTEEAEAVVLADPSGKSAAAAEKILGTKLKAVAKDAAEMLRKEKPALALISLSAVASPPAIDLALEAGCHVFCEKPGCVRAADFRPLARKAEQTHRHLMLALANRTHAPVREGRRLIAEGKLGKLYGVEVHIVADQTRLKREEYRKQWYCIKARAGGGHLTWLGIHWLDLALYMTGLKVRQVAGFAGVVGGQPLDIEDSAAAALRFDAGCFGTLTSGYYLDKGYHTHVQVWGEHGWLRLASAEEQPLEWYSTRGVKEPQVQRFEYPKGGRSYTPFVRAAVRASAGLEPAPVSPAECLHVLETIFAFYEAARTGTVQDV